MTPRRCSRQVDRDELLSRWGSLRDRFLRLVREREQCDFEEPGDEHYPGTPPCYKYTDLMRADWCASCLRSHAVYLMALYLRKRLRLHERKMLRWHLAERVQS